MISKISHILKEYNTKIIAILLVNIFTLWLLTIVTTHISEYPPDALYYAKQMPVFYWIGIVLSCIIIFLLYYIPLQDSKKNILIEIGLLVLLILYLFGIPSFIYDNARLFDVHIISRYVENLVIEGHTVGDKLYIGIFTGSTISFSALSMISNTDILLIAKYYTIYLMFVVSLGLYSFAKRLTNKYYIFAPITHLSVAWMSINHMTPQPYAFMLTIFLRLRNY